VSVLIDLSKVARRQKVEYLHTLLPFLRAFRRRTGLPHKILIDEAHDYLPEPEGNELVDADLGGYVLVSYRLSDLAESIRTTPDAVVFVTCERDEAELATLASMCKRRGEGLDVKADALCDLATNEAALLPGSDESGSDIRRFRLIPRLTSHVRHRVKYLDMGVLDDQAFVFDGSTPGQARARTLREFMELLQTEPPPTIEGHLERHDFSRWLLDVFRDAPLAARVHDVEGRAGTEDSRDLATDISHSIRARYETTGEKGLS
jgi:hypothetical protein